MLILKPTPPAPSVVFDDFRLVLPPKNIGRNSIIGQGWYRLHRDMLVHHEVNAYLAAATSWEKLLEVSAGMRADIF